MATGKSRELKRELLRMSWLIRQLQRDGIGQAEMERRTGIESSHLNKLLNYEGARRKGLGADIIRQVRDGLKIDLGYFFDDYDGERNYKVYPLSAKRDEKRVSDIESDVAELKRGRAADAVRDAERDTEMARLRALLLGKDEEIASPRAQLRAATGPRARR